MKEAKYKAAVTDAGGGELGRVSLAAWKTVDSADTKTILELVPTAAADMIALREALRVAASLVTTMVSWALIASADDTELANDGVDVVVILLDGLNPKVLSDFSQLIVFEVSSAMIATEDIVEDSLEAK